ncbi:MAG: hypothetical protein GY750_17990 [Lentisphaerae bacterium]|nr:hypothetical protein [Lentisphaerota bacterium]
MNIRLKPFFIIFVLLLVPIVLLEAVLYYGEMWANRTTSEIQIKEHIAALADALKENTDNFEYETILTLIQ